jgi:hypothetical protein
LLIKDWNGFLAEKGLAKKSWHNGEGEYNEREGRGRERLAFGKRKGR